MGYYVKVAIK